MGDNIMMTEDQKWDYINKLDEEFLSQYPELSPLIDCDYSLVDVGYDHDDPEREDACSRVDLDGYCYTDR